MQNLRIEDNRRKDWAVIGDARFKNVDLGGILEWCRNKQEASREVDRLSEDRRYSNLAVREMV